MSNKKMIKVYLGIAVGVTLLTLGIRILYAKYVYKDMLCVVAECRITK